MSPKRSQSVEERVLKRIENRVRKILLLYEMVKAPCDENVDKLRCALEKAVVISQFNKELEKLVYQLAMVYTSNNNSISMAAYEIVEQLMQSGIVSVVKWEKAVADTRRYREKVLDGRRWEGPKKYDDNLSDVDLNKEDLGGHDTGQ